MQLKDYLLNVRRSWWIVVLATLIGVVAAFAFNQTSTPRYATSGRFFVNSSQTPNNLLQGAIYAQNRVNSYVLVVTGDRLVNIVRDSTQVSLSTSQLADEITATAQAGTVVFDVTVTDPSAARSLQLMTAITTQFPGLVHELDPSVTLQVVSGPSPNLTPVTPRKAINLIVGTLAGLAIGITIAASRRRKTNDGTPDSEVRTAPDSADTSEDSESEVATTGEPATPVSPTAARLVNSRGVAAEPYDQHGERQA